jgi:predicted acylesterase/phospholipase RssA
MTESGARVAVVLSGGGAYGAFEVGVLKALCGGECPTTGCKLLDVDVFTGTSVGSFNAAVMSMQSGVSSASAVKHLEDVWLNCVADCPSQDRANGVYRLRGNPARYLDFNLADAGRALLETAVDASYLTQDLLRRFTSILSAPGSFPRRALGLIDLAAFVSVEPFRELLERNLKLSAVRSSSTMLRIVLTNWTTGEARTFTNADMTDEQGRLVVMGSSAIPGVFPPVQIGKDTYVDGGVVMNTPLTTAIDAGATELHAIYLDPDVSKIPVATMPNTIDTFSRVYTIMLASNINEDIQTASWINGGLETLEKAQAQVELTPNDELSFLRVAAKLAESIQAGGKYKKLTIHRYNPGEHLGGMIGMLNFTEATIRTLIDKGYESGIKHNCKESGCLIPREAAA